MENEKIVSTGIDLVDVNRFRLIMERWGHRFLHRIFTPVEIDYCQAKSRPYLSFAARFAAKEAVRKALDQPLGWRAIEVINGPSGKPRVRLKREICGRIAITLSHTREHALAQAILIGDSAGGER